MKLNKTTYLFATAVVVSIGLVAMSAWYVNVGQEDLPTAVKTNQVFEESKRQERTEATSTNSVLDDLMPTGGRLVVSLVRPCELPFTYNAPLAWGPVQSCKTWVSSPRLNRNGLLFALLEEGITQSELEHLYALDSEAQVAYLESNSAYRHLLNYHTVLTFEQNPSVRVEVFSPGYLDLSGYEGEPLRPVYSHTLALNSSTCTDPRFYAAVKLQSFYTDDCALLSNGFLRAFGTYHPVDLFLNRFTSAVAVANMPLDGGVEGGVLVYYDVGSTKNKLAPIASRLGYSGYGKEYAAPITNPTIYDCSKFGGGSMGDTQTDVSDDYEYQRVLESLPNEARAALMQRVPEGRREWGLEIASIEKNVEAIKSPEDISRLGTSVGLDDILCALYSWEERDALNAARTEYKGTVEQKEFDSFVQSIKSKYSNDNL